MPEDSRNAVPAVLLSMILLLTGCGTVTSTEVPESVASDTETQAPIFSSNVPMEYIVMANESSSLIRNCDRIDLTVDHILYGSSHTYLDEEIYTREDESEQILVLSSDPHFAAMLPAEDSEPVLRYRREIPEDQQFLTDDFRLITASEGEEIMEEAEFDGAFHVTTLRPIGSDLEFYPMLEAEATDHIREEYLLDSATLALMQNTTTLMHADGTEDLIGTMTVSYSKKLPAVAALLENFLTNALTSTHSVTVTLREEGHEEVSFAVKKGTPLEVVAGDGRTVQCDGETVQDSIPIQEDTIFVIY